MNTTNISIDLAAQKQLSAEVLRVYGSIAELSEVLRAIDTASVMFTATYATDHRIYAFLDVCVPVAETWVADPELDFAGLSDAQMNLAFADAILDEAEYWSSLHPLVLEDEYFEIDFNGFALSKGEK